MIIFSKNLGEHGPFGLPGYAYGFNWVKLKFHLFM